MQNYTEIFTLQTSDSISIVNLNPLMQQAITSSGIENGFVIISSRHTTTAITINEDEERLLQDIRAWLSKLAPQDGYYQHNDIHLRDCPPDEPENAHSHLMAMLLGSSETIPLKNGEPMIGQWQSVMLFDLDGPRERTVNIQVIGE
jgi:secondary thiamine-phosphate synthase enzyme